MHPGGIQTRLTRLAHCATVLVQGCVGLQRKAIKNKDIIAHTVDAAIIDQTASE